MATQNPGSQKNWRYCPASIHETAELAGGWSDSTTGDFDVEGNLTIVGDLNDNTLIDAQGFDRVFKVHPGASLRLARLTVQGGLSAVTQGGGGILSAGALDLQQVIARDNVALGLD